MAEVELNVLNWIQELCGSAFGDRFFVAVTRLGDAGLIWILLTALLILIPKTRRVGCVAAVSLLFQALVCNQVLKPLVARTRPCDLAEGVRLLIARPEDFSFPSGHTAAGFAVVTVLWLEKSRLRVPIGILAALIAFSRLYLYVHFPSDVLGGAVLGIASGYLAYFCENVISAKRNCA